MDLLSARNTKEGLKRSLSTSGLCLPHQVDPGIATHFIGNAYTSPLSNQGKSFLQKLLRVLDKTIHTLQRYKDYIRKAWVSTGAVAQHQGWGYIIILITMTSVLPAEWTVGRTVLTGVSHHAFRGKAVTLFFPEVRNKETWWVKDGFPEQYVSNS